MKGPQPYGAYLAKRLCRLYLPYAAGLLLSIGVQLLVPPLKSGNSWMDATWVKSPTLPMVLAHLTGIGTFNAAQFNTAFWTLVVEMRMSLIFPLIVWFTRKTRLRTVLALSAVLATLLSFAVHHAVHSESLRINSIAFCLFLNGSTLAVHFEQVTASWRSFSSSLKTSIVVTASVIFIYSTNWVETLLSPAAWWICSVAAMVLIVVATQEIRVRHRLHNAAVLHLGKISYSVYIVHGTILFGLLHCYWGKVNMLWLLPVYLLSIAIVAEIFHRSIEVPTIKLGRLVGRLLQKKSDAN